MSEANAKICVASSKPTMSPGPGRIEATCAEVSCQRTFYPRKADVARGWGRFCRKSCKALAQTREKGMRHRRYARIDDHEDYGEHPMEWNHGEFRYGR